MEPFKKLSAEIKAKIDDQLKSKEFQEFMGKIKAAGEDSGTFEVVISTADQDRGGDVVDQNGWDLTFFKMNPVVLWAHDYYALPIGACDSIEVKDGKLVAIGKFAPAEANPFAQQVRKLYDLKIVRTTSVGFIPLEIDGQNIKKSELLEFSFVPVPMNPHALSLRQVKEMAIDMDMLKMKGLEIKAEDPKEGDACTMEDGTEGVMKPDKDGVLTCMMKPKADDKSKGEKEVIVDKAGKVLSQKNRDLISNSITQMKESIAALEELLKATEPQGDDQKIQKSKSAGVGEMNKALDVYLENRQVLRMAENAISASLEALNKKIREKSIKH